MMIIHFSGDQDLQSRNDYALCKTMRMSREKKTSSSEELSELAGCDLQGKPASAGFSIFLSIRRDSSLMSSHV